MKWFRLDSDFYKNNDVQAILKSCGPTGIMVWLFLLANLSEEYTRSDQTEIEICPETLRHLCGLSPKKFQKSVKNLSEILHFSVRNIPKISQISVEKVSIFYPKFLEKQKKFFATEAARCRKKLVRTELPSSFSYTERDNNKYTVIKDNLISPPIVFENAAQILKFWNGCGAGKKCPENFLPMISEKVNELSKIRFNGNRIEIPTIQTAIENYASVITNDKYFYSYKFELLRFLEYNKIRKFLPGSFDINEFLNFKDKEKLDDDATQAAAIKKFLAEDTK